MASAVRAREGDRSCVVLSLSGLGVEDHNGVDDGTVQEFSTRWPRSVPALRFGVISSIAARIARIYIDLFGRSSQMNMRAPLGS
jgi:hypothetical protein